MITLRQLPYIDILSLNDMMYFDTKVNIIEHCKLARIEIPKSWRKAQICLLYTSQYGDDCIKIKIDAFNHMIGSKAVDCCER